MNWVRSFHSVSQLLCHGLSYLPHASSLPLHPPLSFGGGTGCAGEEGGPATGGAAFFLHHTARRVRVCLSPHWCHHSPAQAKGGATRWISCSSCCLLHCHRLKSHLPAHCSPILSDTAGKPKGELVRTLLSFSTALPVI